ncbi:DUF2116 family Zn-ribbon domain-containing protein [Candidatus Bathyarchaeota archaeon]|nr:MAG: DUF2116 family Zn-ribbon domain-containing protein [Candidatus Bathyarchaeota archaeon]
MAKKRRETQNIPPHKHCKECGVSISPDKTFCSKRCESAYEKRIKKQRRMNYIFLAMMFVLLLIISFTQSIK